MIVQKGSIHYDSQKGVFWQRSFFENEQGQIFLTVIICASEEFLQQQLKQKIEYIMNTNVSNIDIQKWFEEKITTISVMEKESQNQTLGNLLYDLYPKTNAMLYAAKSFLNL